MRKVKTITIEGDKSTNRDASKMFLLTEMPAVQAEKWALRAFLALAHSGVDLPEEVSRAGMAGLAIAGLKALTQLRFEDAEPLLDEMFDCVRIIRDPRNPSMSFDVLPDDIEEVSTRLLLRSEVLQLHTGFSMAEMSSASSSTSASPDLPATQSTSPQ